MFGPSSWAAAGGPDPECLGIHRLSEEAVLMSDTCNAAEACKRLVAAAAEDAGKGRIGADAWEAMSADEQSSSCKVHNS